MGRLVLHGVAVTNDERQMLCVGTLEASSDGLTPTKCRAERQILSKSEYHDLVTNVCLIGNILKVYDFDDMTIHR